MVFVVVELIEDVKNLLLNSIVVIVTLLSSIFLDVFPGWAKESKR